jgi:hypothetical protein
MVSLGFMGKLEQVIEDARMRLELDLAQNPELRRAIHIVEDFLQKKKRVCYGGQAINVQLPQVDQFYNPETALPDYDFFSPDADRDAQELVEDFKEAGYTEISKRIGMHEGTIKIYINYNAIADITQIDPHFYETIYDKSVIVNGIHYTDPFFLRMLMYLELSRPRGNIARWTKVYERLYLLNKSYPLKRCKNRNPPLLTNMTAYALRPALVRYMLDNNRVFMGLDTYVLYRPKGNHTPAFRTKFLMTGNSPIIFLSPDAEMDSVIIGEELQTTAISIVGYENMLPAMMELYKGEDLVCIIVQEEACHSMIKLSLTEHHIVRVGSLETMLMFIIGLYYRSTAKLISMNSLLCLVEIYISLMDRYKKNPTRTIPAFPIECSGYQTTFASLLRAKHSRIEAQRQSVTSGRSRQTSRARLRSARSRRTLRSY